MTKTPTLLSTLKTFRDKETKQNLLEWGQYETIYDAKKKMNLKKADEVYQALMKNYNETINAINKNIMKKQEKTQQKKTQKREKLIANMIKRNQEIQQNIQQKRQKRQVKIFKVAVDVKTKALLKNQTDTIPWKNQEHYFTFETYDEGNLTKLINDEINTFYPTDESFATIKPTGFTFTIIKDDIKKTDLLDVPMKRAKPIKPAFVKWFDNIDEISYEDHNDKCVPKALQIHLNIKKEKTITDVFYEASLKLYNKPWIETEGVTSRMIKYFCQQKHISCLGLDQRDKCFVKYSVTNSGKYKPIVFYMIAGHFYIMTGNLLSITHTFNSRNSISSSLLKNDDKQQTEYKYINAGDLFQNFNDVEEFDDEGYMIETERDFEAEFKLIETLEPNTCVLYPQANLNDELKAYVKIYNSVPSIKYESKSNCKSIKLKNNILLTITETLVSNDVIKSICEKENITYKNQSIGTLINGLTDKYFDTLSERVTFTHQQRDAIIKSQNGVCKCCKKESNKFQIDHIRPLANGGTNDINNLQALCLGCHREKCMEEKLNCEYIKVCDYISTYNIEVYNTIQSEFFKKVQFTENLLSNDYIDDFTDRGYQLYSIDKNKCRKNLLINYNYEFPVYSCLDNIKPFDGKLVTGYYYVETQNKFPLRGNGFYSLPMIEYCIENNIISKFDIKYQYKPTFKLQSNYFKPLVEYLLNTFADEPQLQKLSINALIGMFGRRFNEYIESAVVDKNNEDDVGSKYVAFQKPFFNDLNDDFAILTQSVLVEKLEGAYPIYAQILDCEALELHRTTELLKSNGFIPVSIKTDAVVYFSKTGQRMDISNYYWDTDKTILKFKHEDGDTVGKQIYFYNKHQFKLLTKQYNVIQDTKEFNFNVNVAEQLIHSNKGCFLDGVAGTGKTKLVNEINKLLTDKNVIKLTPTNVSALLIEGSTIDKFSHSILTNSKSILKMANVDYIFIDEVSMMKEHFYSVFLAIKYRFPNIKFIIAGDFNQLEPVKDRAVFNYEMSRALYELVDGNKIELTLCRRSDDRLFNLCQSILENKPYSVSDLTNKNWVSYKNLCHTNAKRKEVNNKCMKRFLNEYKPSVTYEVKHLEYDNNTQDYTLCKGMPIISRLNKKSLEVFNNEMFVCERILADTIVIKNDYKTLEIEKKDFNKLFNLAFCITIHKSQGLSIKDKYVIYEWGKLHKRLRYVALTRSTEYNNINLL